MRRLLCGALLLLVAIACGDTQTAAQSSGAAAAPQNPDQVVAEVQGRKITLKELDEKWQSLDPAEQARVTQLLYQNRRNVLELMIGDMLIDEAANAAKTTREQFLQQETAKRAQPVTETDIQQFYDANKDRAQGRPLSDVRGSIQEFLQNQRQQQARAQLVDELKKKRGAASVRVMLDPPRRDVQLAAHDPTQGPANAPVTIVEFSDYQ